MRPCRTLRGATQKEEWNPRPPSFRGELGETGPLGGYQGRFKNFAVEEDDYFLTLCRYVEANALRAELVERAEDWQWSGLWRRIHDKQGEDLPRLSPWPVERPRNWTARVNGALAEEQLQALRECVDRGRPYGGEQWVAATAKRLGLEFTLREPGRPRKAENE